MTAIVVAGAVILGAITIAFILYPVLRTSAVGGRYVGDSAAGDRLAELIAQRDAIYEAIRDADFDRETGKLTGDDHRRMRERLTAEGVRVLQELDELMQYDERQALEQEIEHEIAALREARADVTEGDRRVPREVPKPAEVDGKYVTCHACGERVRAGASFCTHCGASLTPTCPDCGTVVEAGDQFCSSCGAKLPRTAELTEAIQVEVSD